MTVSLRSLLVPVLLALAQVRAETPLPMPSSPSADKMILVVSPKVRVSNVQRIGMNLGIWTAWGAEQLGSNIIKNPGFEGLVDSALATVESSDGTKLTLEGYSIQREDGFWSDAVAEFRTGSSAGKSARIKDFRGAGKGLATVLLNSEIIAAAGDVVALTKVNDSVPPTQWWLSKDQKQYSTGPPRPGSAGLRSLVLYPTAAKPAQANSFLDGITPRSGKLLPIQGKWRFSFWSRTLSGTPRLRVSFARSGSKPFFSDEREPSTTWRQVLIDFDATDNGPDGPLQLQFSATGDGQVALDDVSLARLSDGAFPFRSEVVAALEVLHPAYLRDWQGQLGDTIGNRLAVPFARRASRYRSGIPEDAKYGYSIPEFLQLCSRIGASPWLVLPTTASDHEYFELGEYLLHRDKTTHFREILIEFGNENWNPLFSGAGIQDAKRHGEAAARAFRFVRQGAGEAVPLHTVMNAQFANPWAVAKLADEQSADIIAVAPYFGYDLPASTDSARADSLLFEPVTDSFAQLATSTAKNHEALAVYEINLHTVRGSATEPERDRFVLDPAAGAALAKRLIDGLSAGFMRQCVYTLAEFDTNTSDGGGLVQLWGVVRDLAGPPRLRATGLAVAMLNRAVQEELHDVEPATGTVPDRVTAVVFKGRLGWSVAIVSWRTRPVDLTLSFPTTEPRYLPSATLILAQDIATKPRPESQGLTPTQGRALLVHDGANSQIRVQIPAHSFVVLLPRTAEPRLALGAGLGAGR